MQKKLLTKLFYFKATYLNNVWFVCAQAQTEKGAYNRIYRCLTDERNEKYMEKFKLELSNEQDYEAGFNYDQDFPRE